MSHGIISNCFAQIFNKKILREVALFFSFFPDCELHFLFHFPGNVDLYLLLKKKNTDKLKRITVYQTINDIKGKTKKANKLGGQKEKKLT